MNWIQVVYFKLKVIWPLFSPSKAKKPRSFLLPFRQIFEWKHESMKPNLSQKAMKLGPNDNCFTEELNSSGLFQTECRETWWTRYLRISPGYISGEICPAWGKGTQRIYQLNRGKICGGSRNLISYTSPLSRMSNTDSSGLINDIVASSSLDFFDEALGAVTCSTWSSKRCFLLRWAWLYAEISFGVAVNWNGGSASEETSVSDQDWSRLSTDEVSAMWINVCHDAVDIPHLGDWVLDGDVRAFLDIR